MVVGWARGAVARDGILGDDLRHDVGQGRVGVRALVAQLALGRLRRLLLRLHHGVGVVCRMDEWLLVVVYLEGRGLGEAEVRVQRGRRRTALLGGLLCDRHVGGAVAALEGRASRLPARQCHVRGGEKGRAVLVGESERRRVGGGRGEGSDGGGAPAGLVLHGRRYGAHVTGARIFPAVQTG